MVADSIAPSHNSLERLRQAAARAKREGLVRFPREFVRDEISNPASPPLATLVQSGGEARLKVFLTALMMATRAPHKTTVTATDLAEMLDFNSPSTAGARRVTAAIRELEKLRLLKRTSPPGRVPTLEVLNPNGDGTSWDVNAKGINLRYTGLDIDLWRSGWIVTLSARQLALLIVMRELTNARKPKPGVEGVWADGIRKRQYGLSDDTWTRGTHELRDLGFLTISHKVFSSFGEPRNRNLYSLHFDRLKEPAESWKALPKTDPET